MIYVKDVMLKNNLKKNKLYYMLETPKALCTSLFILNIYDSQLIGFK